MLAFTGKRFHPLILICNSFALAFTRETEQGSGILAFYKYIDGRKSRIRTRFGIDTKASHRDGYGI